MTYITAPTVYIMSFPTINSKIIFEELEYFVRSTTSTSLIRQTLCTFRQIHTPDLDNDNIHRSSTSEIKFPSPFSTPAVNSRIVKDNGTAVMNKKEVLSV